MRIDKSFIYLPRHPLLRALVLIAGTVLLVGVLAMGLLIGTAAVAAAALAMLVRRRLKGRGRRRRDSEVIEGEFTVVPAREPLPSPEQAPTTRSGW